MGAFIDYGEIYRPSFNPQFLEKQKRLKVMAQKERDIQFKMLKGKRIIAKICKMLNVSISEIKRKRCNRKIAFFRFVIYYWLRRLTDYSLTQIAQLLERSDHTTVLHGINEYRIRRAKIGRHLPEITKFKH